MAAGEFTAERLRERFAYDPETGILTYKTHRQPAWVGKPVAVDYRRGYARTRIRRKWVLIHRIAWMIQTGDCPAMIDHINGDRADNRWANLRQTDPFLNQQNRWRPKVSARVGVMGVQAVRGRFAARIRLRNEEIWLGSYATAEEAGAAYMAAKLRLHAEASPHNLPTGGFSAGSSIDAGGTSTETSHARPFPAIPP